MIKLTNINISLILGTISWNISIIYAIFIYASFDKNTNSLILYTLFLILSLLTLASGLFAVIGLILTVIEYCKVRQTNRLLVISLGTNISYLATYLFVMYNLIIVGKGV